MNMNFSKFSTPTLGEDTQNLYTKLYGTTGERFVEVLNTSPNEIAVISKMIAFLMDKKGGAKNGHA